MNLNSANKEQLLAWEKELLSEYQSIQAQKLSLDLTRGKPSSDQLSLSNAIDEAIGGDFTTKEGIDVRNYGGGLGIPGARALGAELMSIPASQVLAGGNASLTLMHQVMSAAHYEGLSGSDSAWKNLKQAKFICPVPGYDRHFSVCEHLSIEMVTVPMTADGPDMDAVEALIKSDNNIVGMWAVPRFSNPTGVVYSESVVKRIAKLGDIAPAHFRVFWDNAYAIHTLDDNAPELPNIWEIAEAEGASLDTVIHFASTSKITFAGAGVAFVGASENNLKAITRSLSFITIGPDKVNQLRHERFFSNGYTLDMHMKKHAEIIKPRFECVLRHLEAAFEDRSLGQWDTPQGGYFISFDAMPGTAKKIVELAKAAGVVLTPAGATYPYGQDPNDANLRIAPTVPSIEEVDTAMTVFVTCVKLASVQKALAEG